MEKNRTERMEIRLTPSEKEKLQEMAVKADKTMSECIRDWLQTAGLLEWVVVGFDEKSEELIWSLVNPLDSTV